MATRVQSAVANSGAVAVTTLGVTLSASPTDGNWLVLAASCVSATAAITISDDANVGWAYITRQGSSTTGVMLAIGKVFSGASATQTVVTSSSGGIAIVIAEYSGDNFVVDRTASATATSATCVSGTTGITSEANGLWVAAIGQRLSGGATFSSPTNSFAIVDQTNTSLATTGDRGVCLLELFPSTTGAASTGVTSSGSGVYVGIITALYEVSGGSGGGGLRLAGHGGLAS